MKRLVAITAIVSGLLLFLVPRYILPACEYEGYPHMHCSDTAQAEYITGVLLIVIGAGTLFLRTDKLALIAPVASVIIYGVSFRLPDKIGYCQSPRMPCNYGMVPGVRFIDVIGTLVMIVAFIGLVKSVRMKGKA